MQRLGRPAGGDAERRRLLPRRVRVPAELGDPELDRMRRDDVVKSHAGLQDRSHCGEVAELDVIGNLRAPERAAVRVRMVRPDIEVDRGAARRVRMGSLREAEQRAHEGQWPNRIPPLLVLVLRVAERVESPRDDEVRGVDCVYRVGDRVHHGAIGACLGRAQVEAEVRLVPNLEDVRVRRPRRETVVVSGESRREIAQVGRPSATRR